MAFSYGDSAANAGTGTSASSGTITANTGNLVVMFICADGTDNNINTPTGGAAFTEFTGSPYSPGGGGATATLAAFWKIAGGSEPSSYSATVDSGTWRTVTYVYSSASDAQISAPFVADQTGANSRTINCEAIVGSSIGGGDVAFVFGAKDNFSTIGDYTTAGESYGNVEGNTNTLMAAGASRIYAGPDASPSAVVIQTAQPDPPGDGRNTRTASFFVSFEESAAPAGGLVGSLAGDGGLAGAGGLAGRSGGLAG